MKKVRTGFTLVELLVVMSLIAVLATMAIVFFPNAATANREANAAQQLQGMLNIAKQRALRDQAPRGLRLWINTSLPAIQVDECQYTEQPDDFSGGKISSGTTTLPNDTITFTSMTGDLVNGYAGEYHECSATIQWTAQEPRLTFVSDAASTSTTRFAEIGRERNGKFFSGD